MSKEQPVYLVDSQYITSAFFEASGKHSGLRFAGSQQHEVLSALNEVIDSQEFVNVSAICTVLQNHKTNKMINNANSGIALIIRRINENKITK